MALVCLASVVTAARLFELTVVRRGDYAVSRESTQVLHAKRGTIYDRNGNVLATSVECKNVICNPTEIDDASALSELLARDLGGNASDYTASLTAQGQYSVIKKRVDLSSADELKGDLEKAGYAGVYFEENTKRVYPNGSVAGQVLGYVGDDGNGLSGLEYYYDKILSGTDGVVQTATGTDGKPIAGASTTIQEATDGQDIVISIDLDIQKMAEEKIAQATSDYNAESGSVMVTDPSTGEILAACSTPLMDPTDASSVTSDSMKLRLTGDSYEPGSIFKVLTMAVGIESGKVTPESTFTVPPKVQLGDDLVGDDDERDYTMDMSCTEILRRSSNTGTALVAQAIGAETFSAGIEKFGIGSKTGVDFPGEQAGIVATGDDVAGANLGFMSFGQGLAFPMVQVVRAVGAIANDGTMNVPHFLVQKAGDTVDWSSKGTKTVSKATCDKVTDMMRIVISEGTGTAAQVTGYDIAGKTGTGEQASAEGGYESGKYVSSLVGFANADDPKVLVYVGLNGTPHLAASSAAPVFSAIMSEALDEMGVKPSA
ncbi:MAG: penicillin-binding protein 2 [Atopobiaceae bacterium]|nr:penicillin-binding protein 2 [Atopobiaceae bacterium]